jgi:hypothetical protein
MVAAGIMWTFLALLFSLPFLLLGVHIDAKRRQRTGQPAPASGGLLGFDELFHPSAHQARLVWETEVELPAPAPTPGDGPGVIQGRRIVIDVAD